jgi:hypothetical protein
MDADAGVKRRRVYAACAAWPLFGVAVLRRSKCLGSDVVSDGCSLILKALKLY